MEDGFAGEAAAQNEDTDAENTAGEETPGTEEETPKTLELERPGAADPAELDLPDGAGSETANPAELDLPDGAGSETADPADPEAGLPDGTGRRPELFDGAVPREGQETPSGIQQKEDGTIYQDGVPYNGYYMDNAGALYSVADGQPTPETGTVAAGPNGENGSAPKQGHVYGRKGLYRLLHRHRWDIIPSCKRAGRTKNRHCQHRDPVL